MKLLQTALVFCLCFFMINGMYAQKSGVITYQESMKFNIQMDGAPEGIDLASMLPTSRSVTKQLIFDNDKSIYINGDDVQQDREFNSDDGSIQIKIMENDIESKLYKDHQENLCLDQQGFMGKTFVINKPISKIKWKITPEKIKYLDYECMKATMSDEEGVETIAWFAPAIPVKAGPGDYGQLPGAILMLSKGDNELEIKATSIELKAVEEIKKPNDGENVTKEEFDVIVEEKMKEMEKEYGGRGIMIRG